MLELDDMLDIIVDAAVGTVGVDLFTYSAPAQIGECIILYPSNDPPVIDPQTPFYFRGRFQTIVRAKTHEAGFAKCAALAAALTKHNVEGTLANFKEIRPLTQPRVYRRSDSGALEFSVHYQVTYVQK